MISLGMQLSHAQSEIDMNRMDRDINIMENVLQEMFKTSWEERAGDIRIRTNALSFGQGGDINDTYVPGYGVIFTIPNTQPRFLMFRSSDDEGFSYQFEYGEDDNGKRISEASITSKIVEFLRDYGSTMSQLSANEKIMVVYKSGDREREIAPLPGVRDEEESKKRAEIPTISVVAAQKDLRAYRSGDLADSQFHNRLEISTSNPLEKGPKDLKIMANILETAFEESEKSFRITGSVDYLKLDNFGALFSFDARYTDRDRWNFSGLYELEIMKENVEEARIEIEQEVRNRVDSTRAQDREKIKQKQAQRIEEITQAYENFLQQLKEYMVDYGRTLSSLDNNQHILVSVSLSRGLDEIPERLDLQVQKSTLSAMDRGNMSREEAIEQIQIREY
jgi:predicted nucleic acid-binding protein